MTKVIVNLFFLTDTHIMIQTVIKQGVPNRDGSADMKILRMKIKLKKIVKEPLHLFMLFKMKLHSNFTITVQYD